MSGRTRTDDEIKAWLTQWYQSARYRRNDDTTTIIEDMIDDLRTLADRRLVADGTDEA